jgi:cytochrome c-type biogenesis protein CcmH/NrfG
MGIQSDFSSWFLLGQIYHKLGLNNEAISALTMAHDTRNKGCKVRELIDQICAES